MYKDILIFSVIGSAGNESIAVFVVEPFNSSIRSTGELCRGGTLLGIVTHPLGNNAHLALSLLFQYFKLLSDKFQIPK